MKKIEVWVKKYGPEDFIYKCDFLVKVDGNETASCADSIVKKALELPEPLKISEIECDWDENTLRVEIKGVNSFKKIFIKKMEPCFYDIRLYEDKIKEYFNNIKEFINEIENWANSLLRYENEFYMEL